MKTGGVKDNSSGYTMKGEVEGKGKWSWFFWDLGWWTKVLAS